MMPDGASVRDHEDSAARQWAMLGKKKPAASEPSFNEEPCPEGAQHVWAWFGEIICGIDGNGWSVPVISWVQLAAWCRLRNVTLEPWEALAIVQLGMLRASVLSDTTNTSTPGGSR